MKNQSDILVVDDNPTMAQTLADILHAKGYQVHTAFCGEEALQVLENEAIDIMLTDVRMPDMSGVELYRRSRDIQPLMRTFLMTAYSADDVIQQGLNEGIKTVLTKPLDVNLLLTLIDAAVSVERYRS